LQITKSYPTLQTDYLKWYSPTLNLDTEMLVYGHYGKPVIIFPTTMGRFFESTDFGLVESAKWFVDEGKVKLYCVDSIDKYSWYNKGAHPAERAKNHAWFDQFVYAEIVRPILDKFGLEKIAVAGASFGAYHAANFAFKHPEVVSDLIAMSGAFDISNFVSGHYDDNIYYNNPVDYLPGSNHPDLWKMNIILGVGEWDICLDATNRLSGILNSKGINHWYDLRRWEKHDWPLWRDMFPHYLSTI
jgi:esterase/lipase superfamily enzyme